MIISVGNVIQLSSEMDDIKDKLKDIIGQLETLEIKSPKVETPASVKHCQICGKSRTNTFTHGNFDHLPLTEAKSKQARLQQERDDYFEKFEKSE
jgi:hypothetical protein